MDEERVKKLDSKGRVFIGEVFKPWAEKSEVLITTYVDHLVVLERKDYEAFVKQVAKENNIDEKKVSIYLGSKTRYLHGWDAHRRIQFTRAEREAIFEDGDELSVVPIHGARDGIETIEIYPKKVYDLIAGEVAEKITNKGGRNEERRRKD